MTRPRHLHSIQELNAMLSASIEALAAELLPGGRRMGREWRCGSLAGEPGTSLVVYLAPAAKRGGWYEFNGGEGGDALELVARTRCGGDRGEAIRWARRWLGLDTGSKEQARVVGPPPLPPAVEQETPNRAGRALWLRGRSIINTPAAAYLAGRGLPIEALPRLPSALRYADDVWCSERGISAPAMLACIVRGSEIIGCHRTFLGQRPDGTWGKAAIKCPKKVLGEMRGGYIPISRGREATPLQEVTEDETVAITEGIEDALTVALHMPEWRVLAAVSRQNMAALELPTIVQRVVLVFDRDGADPAAQRQRDAAIAAHQRAGREVRFVFPPEGYKDVNEWWQADQASRRPRVSA